MTDLRTLKDLETDWCKNAAKAKKLEGAITFDEVMMRLKGGRNPITFDREFDLMIKVMKTNHKLLRKEAIKHVKFNRRKATGFYDQDTLHASYLGAADAYIEFFNITEEELK